ncbi:calcium-binding protein [Tychonema sp. BBK16]|uniref:calcium-binding protein n=1 Tax=Tychonema sp. BBK16 TaxID=2699888 RepID=UPI001F1E8F7E|nr:calcium-binding protein [Tychonema sp. BBK16]MCF6373336.1 calcium-binding protein [Tychonema sp. BBK16]
MTITRVSVDSAGNEGNVNPNNRGDIGGDPSISADGRFVAFISFASNLVPGDTNDAPDIFVRNLLTNTTTRVSVNSAGNQGNSFSGSSSISADGRFVAFSSFASNLVPGNTNTGPGNNIFVRDLLTNTTTRVSVNSADQGQTFESGSPSISSNGRFVAFASRVANVKYNTSDIFVRDLLANTITPVSVDSTGSQRKGFFSGNPSISADGRFVAFESTDSDQIFPGFDDSNKQNIFVRDLSTNTTTDVSVDLAGNLGKNFSGIPSISADGRFVAFRSFSSNLVPGDTNNQPDIFVRDLSTKTTTLVSVNSAGNQGNSSSGISSISADGRFVVFKSDASNLVPEDTNNQPDIFVRDLLTKTTTRVSGDLPKPPGEVSRAPSISADGKFVAFQSDLSNLVPGDTNNATDAFVADIGITPGSINNPPKVINGTSIDDNLTGTPGNDTINGLNGDDAIAGLRGNDILNGDDDDDILLGGKGFDTLNGGLGDDNLIGGVGNDVFILGAGFGVDTISDFGNGQDIIQLINDLTFEELSISPGANGTLIGIAGSDEVLAVLRGVAPNLLGSEKFISG